ncbi:MAG: NAD(P)/FAD-dependent oxidoreductase [Actinomycetota bacterium]|jgi:phytoene dehydrogenase-like protein|nr:NAD(P)/FAD-dependent oxidoreductase [Pseudonocardiales bacterium]MDQ3599947.1 NAD(P)/FAD-dependent oxidoreductase [Actinomycetota bacterium]
MPEVVIVGGGHNGLVAGCYLARAGLDVLVLEQSAKLGGGSRTEELVPGYRFNTHSAAHNIINATDIPTELRLAEAGLEYREMDPFSVAVFTDGQIVRFHRSVEQTVDSIRAASPADADRYARWMRDAMPIITAARAGIEAGAGWPRRLRRLPRRGVAAAQALVRNGGPVGLARLIRSPYGQVLEERLVSELVRGPVSAFAAHASASPTAPGSAMFGLWQAFYHQVGQWHAVGGSQGLIDALARRFLSYGGNCRTDAAVARLVRSGERICGVELEDGSRIDAHYVVTAIDPQTALLDLLEPPLSGPQADALRRAHRGNAVQMLVLLATTALPAYPQGRPGDWNGLQSYVDSVASLADGFARAEAEQLPEDPVPTYTFTPSALDDSLAPHGHHTVYLACPCAPSRLRGGWKQAEDEFAERMIDTVEARAPGFRATVVDRVVRSPEDMTRELRWPGAHPMYLDISLDQLVSLRPTRALAGHATPVKGLFISGAGTSPVGGVAGSPGRAAAKAVLRDRRSRRWS